MQAAAAVAAAAAAVVAYTQHSFSLHAEGVICHIFQIETKSTHYRVFVAWRVVWMWIFIYLVANAEEKWKCERFFSTSVEFNRSVEQLPCTVSHPTVCACVSVSVSTIHNRAHLLMNKAKICNRFIFRIYFVVFSAFKYAKQMWMCVCARPCVCALCCVCVTFSPI